MAAVTVKFDRIGRHLEVSDLTVDLEPVTADAVAEAIYRYSRKFLLISDCFVLVDLEAGTGSLEAGRFGTFAVSIQEG